MTSGRRTSLLVLAASALMVLGVQSAASAVNVAPDNIGQPTVSGIAVAGDELTAGNGTWSGSPTSFTYQWQRCTADGTSCTGIDGATGRTYGVRTADVGRTLRVVVTARNADGASSSTSDRTAAVKSTSTPTTTTNPTTTTPTPTPTPTPRTNQRPTISIISVRWAGPRLYVRFRSCDDSGRNLKIVQRDSKFGVAAYVRHFATLVPPQPCAALTRSWTPAPRFQHGRYTFTLWATDKTGKSSTPARRSFVR
jgi:hypothetical protein